jgi:hypothetical protein
MSGNGFFLGVSDKGSACEAGRALLLGRMFENEIEGRRKGGLSRSLPFCFPYFPVVSAIALLVVFERLTRRERIIWTMVWSSGRKAASSVFLGEKKPMSS